MVVTTNTAQISYEYFNLLQLTSPQHFKRCKLICTSRVSGVAAWLRTACISGGARESESSGGGAEGRGESKS